MPEWEQTQKGPFSRGREAGNLIAIAGARALLPKSFSDTLEPSAGRALAVLCFPELRILHPGEEAGHSLSVFHAGCKLSSVAWWHKSQAARVRYKPTVCVQ